MVAATPLLLLLAVAAVAAVAVLVLVLLLVPRKPRSAKLYLDYCR
jgi:hypothetical protein